MTPAATSYLRPLPSSVEEAVSHSARERVVTAGIVLTVAAVLLQSTVYVANELTFELARLDANGERNLFAWMSTVAIFAASLACTLLFVSGFGRGKILLPLAGFFAFLSLDEAVALHEDVGVSAARLFDLSRPWDRDIWPIVYLPLLVAVLALFRVALRAAPPRTARLVVIGLACLGGAVVAEIGSAVLAAYAAEAVQTAEVVIEEALELGGWCLIATGLLSWFAAPPHGARAVPVLSPV